jgi:hypothetical protein
LTVRARGMMIPLVGLSGARGEIGRQAMRVVAVGVLVAALAGAGVAAASGGPLTLPGTLDGYRDIVSVVAGKSKGDPGVAKHQRAMQAKTRALTVAAYRKAFAGAAVDLREYSDGGLRHIFWVIAVGAPAPGLTIGPVEDPASLGEAVPQREVDWFGPVSCEINRTEVTLAGSKPNPAHELTVACERSQSGVTVFVGSANFRGPSGRTSMVAITNAAWKAVAAR